ncbi:hypothetical protein ADL00_01635 [Streptomyces sp. AS58]|nr:hypothetical protein ADL00_01635 [Streptomyces sp. AS58]
MSLRDVRAVRHGDPVTGTSGIPAVVADGPCAGARACPGSAVVPAPVASTRRPSSGGDMCRRRLTVRDAVPSGGAHLAPVPAAGRDRPPELFAEVGHVDDRVGGAGA